MRRYLFCIEFFLGLNVLIVRLAKGVLLCAMINLNACVISMQCPQFYEYGSQEPFLADCGALARPAGLMKVI